MHTGIRLKIDTPAGVILEGDSDWLHMCALAAEGAPVPDFADTAPPQPAWHQVIAILQVGPDGTPVPAATIWIQPVQLADSYPDDEDQGEPIECPVCHDEYHDLAKHLRDNIKGCRDA